MNKPTPITKEYVEYLNTLTDEELSQLKGSFSSDELSQIGKLEIGVSYPNSFSILSFKFLMFAIRAGIGSFRNYNFDCGFKPFKLIKLFVLNIELGRIYFSITQQPKKES